MIDEPYIKLNDIPKLTWIPGSGKSGRLGIATVYRWAKQGLRGRQLRTARVGRVWVTTETWLREFFDALAGITPPVKPAQQHRRFLAAERELDKIGI